MKITVWIVTTCIPERGETEPCLPSVFATEAEALAYLDASLRSDWENNQPYDDEGNPKPYPGHWQEANDWLAADDGEGTYGQWQVNSEEIEVSATQAFNNAVETAVQHRFGAMMSALSNASGAICSLQEQIDQMSGMFSDSDGAIAQSIEDGDEALAAIKSVLPDSNPPTAATY